MELELIVTGGPDRGERFTVAPHGTALCGRSNAAQCKLTDPEIGVAHFELKHDGEGLWVTDWGPGIKVNGRRTKDMELQVGDVVSAGGTELRVQKKGAGAAAKAAASPVSIQNAPKAAPDAPAAPDPAPAKPKTDAEAAASLDLADPAWHRQLKGKMFQHFQVGPLIAEGRSTINFRGVDTNKKRPVVIRVIRPEHTNSDEKIQRFVRAMKTVINLIHPNIIKVYGAGKYGKICWFADEHIDGENLEVVIERIGISGMLDWTYAYRVAFHVASALDYAFEQEIIHRNITPANIFVSRGNVVKLGEFLLAKSVSADNEYMVTRADKPGEMVGEDVNYVPPERFTGAEIDCRSDIYALGATVYALLTGKAPLDGVNPIKAITSDVKVPRTREAQIGVPEIFDDVVMQMISKRPEMRYETPRELLKALDRVAKYTRVAL